MKALTLAVPKGRTLKALLPRLRAAGLSTQALETDDRTLIRTLDGGEVRVLLLKPDDVPTYVEYGAADLGICGRDVLVERACDLFQPLDLNLAVCRMAVAGLVGVEPVADMPRVATKYPRTASMHFAKKGVQAEIIYVQGSVELAPLTGLADLIVDLVETGTTLVQNGLEIKEEVSKVSAMVVANRASYKLYRDRIVPFLDRLRASGAPG